MIKANEMHYFTNVFW